MRHNAATTTLFPAEEAVPCTIMVFADFFISKFSSCSPL
jgi:hypothetical protein